jgi:hypothetical protein
VSARHRRMARGVRLQSVIPVVLAAGLGFVGAWGFAGWEDRQPALLATSSACNPNYVGQCLPISGPDIDCADVGGLVRIIGVDVFRLDADGDGEGCEHRE